MTIQLRFHLRRGEFLLDVDLELPGSGVTAIFGPSGGGKTTLLRAVAGLERDPAGACRVLGEVWQDAGAFLPPHRRPLGYVFQEASLFPHLSVRANLAYGHQRVAARQRRVSLDEAAALLGVESLLNRHPESLSGGERQRVAIARALLTSPKLLLMDEPLASLDRPSKRDIVPYLERLHDELAMPVLYISHAADEVARLADHLVVLEAGQVRASGPITELLTRLDLASEQGDEAEAVIQAVVSGHDEQFHLSFLEFSGGRFCVARNHLQEGQSARLRVLARDVSLTLERQIGTSILNIFPATVDGLVDEGPGQVLVRLNIGGAHLLSRVTRKSSSVLGLEPGRAVYAQIKAVALVD
jgi:molybdate transport system ATP-binding protein